MFVEMLDVDMHGMCQYHTLPVAIHLYHLISCCISVS